MFDTGFLNLNPFGCQELHTTEWETSEFRSLARFYDETFALDCFFCWRLREVLAIEATSHKSSCNIVEAESS